MPTRSHPLFDLTALHRPTWWAALALLLVNDNLLKGGGVVPGWLTGKLSDFAFLIVAPVLLAAILPRRIPYRRTIALGAVAVVYTAADLFAAVSEGIVSAAHVVGLPWQLWPDATDLMALVVLPLTWWAMHSPVNSAAAPTDHSAARPRPLLESAGVFAGAFACLATSAPPNFPHNAFLVNQTAQPRDITLTWVLRKLQCDGDLAQQAASLNPGDLDDAHTASLPSGDIAALDVPPLPGQPLVGRCSNERVPQPYFWSQPCRGVLVQAGSELSILAVFPQGWQEYDDGSFLSCSDDSPKSECRPHFSVKDDPGPDALSLRERGGKLVLSVGLNSRVRVVEVSPMVIAGRPSIPPNCRSLMAEQEQITGAAATCSTDADCKATTALPIPGRSCLVHTNRTVSESALASLKTRWEQSCVAESNNDNYRCPPAQPAACLAGRCQEICPGVELPTCPYRCGADTRNGSTCYGSATCEGAEGTWCICENGAFNCRPPPAVPGCSIVCVRPNDRSAPPPDAGSLDSRPNVRNGADAGGTDADAGGGS